MQPFLLAEFPLKEWHGILNSMQVVFYMHSSPLSQEQWVCSLILNLLLKEENCKHIPMQVEVPCSHTTRLRNATLHYVGHSPIYIGSQDP